MYACICHGLTERDLRAAIRHHEAASVDEVRAKTGATGCCGSCHEQVAFILEQERVVVVDAAIAVRAEEPARLGAVRAVA